jgi:hypothetical protein
VHIWTKGNAVVWTSWRTDLHSIWESYRYLLGESLIRHHLGRHFLDPPAITIWTPLWKLLATVRVLAPLSPPIVQFCPYFVSFEPFNIYDAGPFATSHHWITLLIVSMNYGGSNAGGRNQCWSTSWDYYLPHLHSGLSTGVVLPFRKVHWGTEERAFAKGLVEFWPCLSCATRWYEPRQIKPKIGQL